MLAAFIDKTYVRPRAAVLRCSTQGENEKKTGERIFVYSFPKFVVKFRIGEEPAKIDAEGNEARERETISPTQGDGSTDEVRPHVVPRPRPRLKGLSVQPSSCAEKSPGDALCDFAERYAAAGQIARGTAVTQF